MAKEIVNDQIVKLECYYDTDAAAWKARACTVVCDSTDNTLARRKSLEMDLSSGTFQADVDALCAEALAQSKTDEGIA